MNIQCLNQRFVLPIAILAAIASTAAPAAAVEKAGDVVFVRGKASIERKTGRAAARVASALMETDSIVTRDKSRVKMLFRDDSVLTLGANSRLIVKKYLYSPESKRAESICELADGRLRSVVGSSSFKVMTPTAFAAARGTVFTVFYNKETGMTEITVLEGMVEVRNVNEGIAGVQVVTAGQATKVSGDQPPTTPVPADVSAGGTGDGAAGGLPAPGTGAEGTPHIINDLLYLAEHGMKPAQPIEQEPAQATTRVFLNVQFPQ